MASTWARVGSQPWEIREDGQRRPVSASHPRLVAYLDGYPVSALPELELPAPPPPPAPADVRAALYRERCDPLLASALAYRELGDPREAAAWDAWEAARAEIQAAHPDVTK